MWFLNWIMNIKGKLFKDHILRMAKLQTGIQCSSCGFSVHVHRNIKIGRNPTDNMKWNILLVLDITGKSLISWKYTHIFNK